MSQNCTEKFAEHLILTNAIYAALRYRSCYLRKALIGYIARIAARGGGVMTEGEKALQELGYVKRESQNNTIIYEFGLIGSLIFYGWGQGNKTDYWTVAAYGYESGEPLDIKADLLQAMLLRLQELNQAVE